MGEVKENPVLSELILDSTKIFSEVKCSFLSILLGVKGLTLLTPRVKPWVKQSFLAFDSMDRTLKCDHSLESCWAVLYCGAVSFPTL